MDLVRQTVYLIKLTSLGAVVLGLHLIMLMWVQVEPSLTSVRRQPIWAEIRTVVAIENAHLHTRHWAGRHHRSGGPVATGMATRPETLFATSMPVHETGDPETVVSTVNGHASTATSLPLSEIGPSEDSSGPDLSQRPSGDADELNNPPPQYPAISRSLGEEGRVVVRVLIGHDGTAIKGEINQSSGFDRLDQAALFSVMAWRYRQPSGKDTWLNIPVRFTLN